MITQQKLLNLTTKNNLKNRRKLVIHHTHLILNIMDYIEYGDIVFFDDCVYSQYQFIKQNIQKLQELNTICILGLSTNFIRPEYWQPIIEKTNVLHDQLHNNNIDALKGFMSKTEIVELLKFDNILLACHGHNHLQLEKIPSKLDQARLFSDDIKKAIFVLDSDPYLTTDIFVYPYAYDFYISDKILKLNGYKYIYAGANTRRIAIESIVYDNKFSEDS